MCDLFLTKIRNRSMSSAVMSSFCKYSWSLKTFKSVIASCSFILVILLSSICLLSFYSFLLFSCSFCSFCEDTFNQLEKKGRRESLLKKIRGLWCCCLYVFAIVFDFNCKLVLQHIVLAFCPRNGHHRCSWRGTKHFQYLPVY